MKRPSGAFTLVEIMITVGIVVVLAALTIPYLLRTRLIANEALVRSTMTSVSKAIEIYRINTGAYPTDMASLTSASPAYLHRDLFAQSLYGYTFNADLSGDEYAISATPITLGQSGSTTFVVTTGGVFHE